MDQKLRRSERLKSRAAIQTLFSNKSASISAYPIRLIYTKALDPKGNYPIQIAVSVPKRRYKKAVDRNRIKRLLREAYRLHKADLYQQLPPDSPQYACMLIYVGKEEEKRYKIERKMKQAFKKFLSQING